MTDVSWNRAPEPEISTTSLCFEGDVTSDMVKNF